MISDTPTDAEIEETLKGLDLWAARYGTSSWCADAAKCIRWLQHEMNTAYWNEIREENTRLKKLNDDKFNHLQAYCKAASEDKAEIARLQRIIEKNLTHTADGKLVCELQQFYCFKCARELRQGFDLLYCDDCTNPDDFGTPPLPVSYSMAYSTAQAALANPAIDWDRVELVHKAAIEAAKGPVL
jgi:hypothetical protein